MNADSKLPSFSEWTAQIQQRTAVALAGVLPAPAVAPQRLHEAMRYAGRGGGKRGRPLRAHAAGTLAGAAAEDLDRIACAVLEPES